MLILQCKCKATCLYAPIRVGPHAMRGMYVRTYAPHLSRCVHNHSAASSPAQFGCQRDQSGGIYMLYV